MAAAVMTRRNKSHKVRSMVQPARLQLNGATLRETHASLSHSCEDCTSSGGSGSSSGDGAGAERIRQRKDAISLSVPTLSPGTQDSINLVFSFDMKGADFEESVREIWPRRCTFVVKELIETERVYVRALGDIIKGYITPLYCYLLSSGDGPGFIRTVFSNIVKIHRCHLDILDSLQRLVSDPKGFACVFVDTDFSMYTEYCTNYTKGNECLEQALANNSDLRSFIEECQMKLVHSLPLYSYLIKPVQRILKYPLMLEELAKNFSDSDEAYSTIQEAFRRMTEVAEHINSSFHKPVKKHRLTPSAIARIRSKEVEVLQRSRTLTPSSTFSSPAGPTSAVHTFSGYTSKRSVSVEPLDTTRETDKVRVRTRWQSEKLVPLRRHRLHRSVESLDVEASSSTSDEHMARVRNLKRFFENLSKTDTTVAGTSVTEAAPLMPRRWAAFEVHSSSSEDEKTDKLKNGRTHVEWPPLRKTGRRFSPAPPPVPHSEIAHNSPYTSLDSH